MTTDAHIPVPDYDCEREPIRIPGLIQSHGLLIALRFSDLTILQISENTQSLLGIEPQELLHQPLSKLMAVGAVEQAKIRMGERQPRILNPLPIEIRLGTKKIHFDGILHRAGRILILELERHVQSAQDQGVSGLNSTVRSVTTKIIDSPTLEQTLQVACDELLQLTQYSRVLIYRFDDTWDGQVVAEALGPDGEALLHHRFPASDIPAQARELYTTNWVRIIPDINYVPSRLVPEINPITDQPTDLSNAVLRSVSPIHLEYMRNMGYEASLSVSLLKNNKLWGLIACHNRVPKYLTYETRIAAEFVGQIVSSQIATVRGTRPEESQKYLTAFLEELLRMGGSHRTVLSAAKFNPSLILGIVNAQGLAIVTNDGTEVIGLVPAPHDLQALNARLELVETEVFSTRAAKRDLALDERVVNAAGVLAFTVGTARWIFFRPERIDSISWSGNPAEAKLQDKDGRVRPRKSFATWVETVRDTCDPWRQSEVRAATELKKVLESLNPGLGPVTRPRLATSRWRLGSPKPASNALASFPDLGAMVINADGEIVQWSDGAETLLGYSSSQVLKQNLDLLFSEDDRLRGTREKLINEARESRLVAHESWLYRADGTTFWAKVRLTRVFSNTTAAYSVLIEDITREKLSQEELKSTKVAAEAANVAKTSFLANISHEIRTPLGAVLGFAELLALDEIAGEERRRLFDRIRSNGDQLLTLINDLLDMTKVESNKLEIESLRFDFNAFLIDLSDTFSLKARERGVNYETLLIEALPRFVLSDPTRLRQVLVNLVSNAIKFTESGGWVRMIVTFGSDLGKRRLEFRVTDTGRGMSEREMARIFQPFVQADISTTRKYGGTGLGLFISQRIARLLSGDLSIEDSKVGAGSTFLAWIEPAEVSETDVFRALNEVPLPAAPVNRPSSGRPLSDRRVLVVDDSIDNRELIGVFLENVGAEITLADNGEHALNVCAGHEFDVILMDLQMPVMDGPTAVRKLVERGVTTPIVALTAHAMVEEKMNILDRGFADYVTKPINWTKLIAVIDRLCSEV